MQDKHRDEAISCLAQDLDQYLESITDLACSVHKAAELQWIPKDDLTEAMHPLTPLNVTPVAKGGFARMFSHQLAMAYTMGDEWSPPRIRAACRACKLAGQADAVSMALVGRMTLQCCLG